jgi:aminopeptidase-like protein
MTPTTASAGAELHAFASELYPICRSITGAGVRKTLELIGRRIELERHEVPSGTKVFDWEVPPEWNIEGAWVRDADGRRVVDFSVHNLHILNYSEPVRTALTLEELKPRLHSIPAHEDWIPYRTSYYRRQWGFCMRHRELVRLRPGKYEVVVDSSLAPGSLSYAECVLPGRSKEEVLFFTHTCHPSLANDNTSGMAIATALAAWIAAAPRRYCYRFVFAPARSDRCAGCNAMSGDSAEFGTVWCSACWVTRRHSPISAAGVATAKSIAWSSTSYAPSIRNRGSFRSSLTVTMSANCARPGSIYRWGD